MANTYAPPTYFTEGPSLNWSVTGTITNNATSIICDVSQQNGATISWYGTFGGIAAVFEALYDLNGTWVSIQATPVSGGQAVTSVSSLSTAGAYEVYAPGAYKVRFRSTAYTSGIMNVRITPVALLQDSAPAVSGGSMTLGVSTNLVGDVGIGYRTSNSGAASFQIVNSPATPVGTIMKASAGRVLGFVLNNSAATLRSVKLFNTATAITMGTTGSLIEIDIPPGATVCHSLEGGLSFGTGIGFAVTGAKGSLDNTAVTLGDVTGWIAYA